MKSAAVYPNDDKSEQRILISDIYAPSSEHLGPFDKTANQRRPPPKTYVHRIAHESHSGEDDGFEDVEGRLVSVEPWSRRTSSGLVSLSSGVVSPAEQIEDYEIFPEQKTKPRSDKLKPWTSVGKLGASISHEDAIHFMIHERQMMDQQQAALRIENENLKLQLSHSGAGGLVSSPATTQGSATPRSIQHDRRASHSSTNSSVYSNINLPSYDSRDIDDDVRILTPKPPSYPPGSINRYQAPSSSSSSINKSQLSSQDVIVISKHLWVGAELWKIPYNGKGLPDRRYVTIKKALFQSSHRHTSRPVAFDDDPSQKIQGYIFYPPTLVWFTGDPGPDNVDPPRELPLTPKFTSLTSGYATPAFARMAAALNRLLPDEELCFSIRTKARTLDLACDNVTQANEWQSALESLVFYVNNGSSQPAMPSEQRCIVELFNAAETGDAKTIARIITQGVSINTLDTAIAGHLPANRQPCGETPLFLACRHSHSEAILTCLAFGAKNDPHPEYGHTALHSAMLSSQPTAASILLSTAHESGAATKIANLPDSLGNTPLHVGCMSGQAASVRVLLHHGAEVSVKNSAGRCPMHMSSAQGHIDCAVLLLEHGADDLLDEPDNDGNTALHLAARAGYLDLVRLLLETAAAPHQTNLKGESPLSLAEMNGHAQVASLIQEYLHLHLESLNRRSRKQVPRQAVSRSPASHSRSAPSLHHVQSSIEPAPLTARELSPPVHSEPKRGVSIELRTPLLPTHTSYPATYPIENKLPFSSPAPLNQSMASSVNTPASSSSPMTPPRNQAATIDESPLTIRKIVVGSKYFSDDDEDEDEDIEVAPLNLRSGPSDDFGVDQPTDDSGPAIETSLTSDVHRPTRRFSEYVSSEDVGEEAVSPPIEVFVYEQELWHVYVLAEGDEQYPYYHVPSTGHSQWEDPRVHGILDS